MTATGSTTSSSAAGPLARVLGESTVGDPRDARAGPRGRSPRLAVRRLHPHASGPDLPDRQPVLRLEVRVGARAVHARPPHLPRPRQGARRARRASTARSSSAATRSTTSAGPRIPGWRRGTTPTACRTSSAWRRAWRPRRTTRSAATTVRSSSSAARRRTRCSGRSSAAQEAGYAYTRDVNGYRQEGFAPFDRNIHRGRRL